MSGDNLTICVGLLSAVLACMIGALTAPADWRGRTLWTLTVLFGAVTLAWWLAPVTSPLARHLFEVLAALFHSGGFVMLGTVSVVALMVGSSKPEASRKGTPEAVAASQAHQTKIEAGRVIDQLQRAKDNAAIALSRRSEREAERALPRVKAALLSANKQFGIPAPTWVDLAIIDLHDGVRVIEESLPFLRDGHVEEAREAAKSYLAKLVTEQSK